MLNPIVYTERVISDFLSYQLTAYPFADRHLYQQMRRLLNLETTRNTPLFKGPYISLSQSFRQGASIDQLIAEGVLHEGMKHLVPYSHLYGHQETAIRHIHDSKTTIISTGTGSGKTECFLYPIISHCLTLRDQRRSQGITAVIIYPMNALAEDQLERLRSLLVGTGISFGMYVGKTPEEEVTGRRCGSKAEYESALRRRDREKSATAIHPKEERVSRAEMRKHPPQILLTNVKQLELLLTRQRDIEMFNGATLDFLVVDEAHTFSGSQGAETACLIRRLRAFCGKQPTETICIATSATIADPHTTESRQVVANFAHRFFGVPQTQVELVVEEYDERPNWAQQRCMPPVLTGDPQNRLNQVLAALEDPDAGTKIPALCQEMWGEQSTVSPDRWQEWLYERLSANELVFQLHLLLRRPKHISDLVQQLRAQSDRPISEEEILLWLALGAASRQAGRPLLRPVIHGFVRGVGSAVVTFGEDRPTLWFASEDTQTNQQSDRYPLPVLTCTTCGQHYFEHWVADFVFVDGDKAPRGGEAHNRCRIWRPLTEEQGGKRILLTDRLISAEEEDDTEEPPSSTATVYFCPTCGTLHDRPQQRCLACQRLGNLVPLLVIQQKQATIGQLHRCICCGTRARRPFGRVQEPARAVRAITVSDVHVLAQNMLHYSDRKRLLIFADNRQDAAFQAGWMQDHARRFRLRALMDAKIRQGAISIGDLTAYLDELLDRDDDLSRSLIPEVWQVQRKEESGIRHQQERKYFLRIQILREITNSLRQRTGLEPLGRFQIEYAGLTPEHSFIQKWSSLLGISPLELCQGIACLLDTNRRNGIVLDRDRQVFSRVWQEGNHEVQYGYLPILQGVPRGLKLTRAPSDNRSRVQQWFSEKADTIAKQIARKWGVVNELTYAFFTELWQFLTQELPLLVPSSLLNSEGKRLPNCDGVYQIDADKLRLLPHQGVYRCNSCRRAYPRPTPKNACIAWRCDGTLTYEPEDPDNYDLRVLAEQFTLILPREHSAQVPTEDREVLERMFKNENQQQVNTLVCTPTLEMGIDIGALDVILMRNIPPLPANYWQRAGRAGRRFRMAVNLTYARPTSHDRSYFCDPLKLLAGEIQPPRINLRNTLMIQKHIHAAVLTTLYQLTRSPSPLSEQERQTLQHTLKQCFPSQVKTYLFDEEGCVRREPLAVDGLREQIQQYRTYILDHINRVFRESWTEQDRSVVTEEFLVSCVDKMHEHLQEVIRTLWKRLQWALAEISRLNKIREVKGTLDPDEDAHYKRCDRLVKQLKGQITRRPEQGEGFDDTNTYGVLAVEGFLPGYGLDTGSIQGMAIAPFHIHWLRDFTLPRPAGVALRECAPGNLIYANNNRFTPRRYHLEPSIREHTLTFQVDTENGAVVELGNTPVNLGAVASRLRAIPMCDVDLSHLSTISDEETFRFQMPVTVLGYERNWHGGGKAYTWGTQRLILRENVHLRLVNVGTANAVREGRLGYTLCPVCGQSRSPFASAAELQSFSKDHNERCNAPLGKDGLIEPTGFFVDITAHTLSIQDCSDRTVAYSVLEAIRHGATHVLEMELEDLQILVIAQPSSEKVDGLLYDPMPGGSGLLEQLVDNWSQVVASAMEVVDGCSSKCKTACIDCLFTFRNAFYHGFLNRHTAKEKLEEWGDSLSFSYDLPPKLPITTDKQKQPTNPPEARLLAMLKRAGLPDPIPQHQIDLGKPLGITTPDFFYPQTEDTDCCGLCIYLDGMGKNLHGNPDQAQRDRVIREELRNNNYEVVEVIASNLDDVKAMTKTISRIARILLGKDESQRIKDDPLSWFAE
jgi:superfamily II DNA helicase RecQ